MKEARCFEYLRSGITTVMTKKEMDYSVQEVAGLGSSEMGVESWRNVCELEKKFV